MICLLCDLQAVHEDPEGFYCCDQHFRDLQAMSPSQKLAIIDLSIAVDQNKYLIGEKIDVDECRQNMDECLREIAEIINDATHPRLELA